MSSPRNRRILDEVNRAKAWKHALKKRPVWAQPVRRSTRVETLEGLVQARAGDYLCRGEAGEIWPQKGARLNQNYVSTSVVDSEGWRLFMPNRKAKGVWAAKVSHPFSVEADRGKFSGKAGDYLIKNYDDKEVEYPQSIWIVDKVLFAKTYRIVTAAGRRS